MSFFDPQSLYTHVQRSTHKGQILQKKPKKKLSATSPYDIPFAKAALLNQGYQILAPGQTISVPTITTQWASFSYLSDNPTNTKTITYNSIWNYIKPSFSDLLSIPESELTGSSSVIIAITSIYARFQGSYTPNNLVQVSSGGQLHLNFSNIHVANNTYYSITPTTSTGYLVFRTTPQGGGYYNQLYEQAGSPGLLSETASIDTWSQLKDQGLTNDIDLVYLNANNISNYVSELRINGFILCQLGVYAT